uniref:LRR-RLK n=1 Tax=Rhizophora mucronata TaxID=61149 RepID=A0A2P2NZL4_RHIMU
MIPVKELLRKIMDFMWVRFLSSGASVPLRERFFKFRTTTFPSEHSTPNHEQGSTLSFQFINAPRGSLTILSFNFNNATPSSLSEQHKIKLSCSKDISRTPYRLNFQFFSMTLRLDSRSPNSTANRLGPILSWKPMH